MSYLIVGGFGSLTIIFYLNGYLYYAINDYKFFEDISSINIKIDKHNKRIDELKQKVVQIKTDLKQGNTAAIGDNQMGLAQNILKQNK